MSPERVVYGAYFDTPARAERLQLLQHLVRNADDVVYLRAPTGAGKTVFAHRLLERLGDELATVWLRAGVDDDVPTVVADQLGLGVDEVVPWPDALLSSLDGQELLVVVDDADQLGLAAFERLSAMHERGGRLLLVGEGGLANTTGNWDVQFVDLPGFSSQQTTAFLRARADDQAERVTSDIAAALHRATHGMPGPLLEALDAMLARARPPRSVPAPGTRPRRALTGYWLGGALAVILLGGTLLFEDQINALFEPGPGEPPVSAGLPAPRQAAEADPGSAGQIRRPVPARPAVGESPPAVDSDDRPQGLAAEPGEPLPAAPPPAPAGRGEDPLEAVLRDALLAAEKPADDGGTTPAPADATPAEPRDPAREGMPEAAVVAVMPPGEEASPTVPPAAKEPELTTVPSQEPPLAPTVPAEQPPAPVVAAKPSVERPAAGVESPQPVPKRLPAEVETREKAVDGGVAWLNSRNLRHYTLQLVGTRDRQAIEQFIRDHAVAGPYAVFERDLDGRPWYSLVAGDYPDRAAALAARERLPRSLGRSGVWPRTFESIKKSM